MKSAHFRGKRFPVFTDHIEGYVVDEHCGSPEIYLDPFLRGKEGLHRDVHEAFEAEFPDKPARSDYSDNDPDKEAGFAVLKCRAPAVLVECEFMDTAKGEKFLAKPSNRDRVSSAIVEGVVAHLGVDTPETHPNAPQTTPEGNTGQIRVELLAARNAIQHAIDLL